MAIRIIKGGVTIEVDSEKDLRIALSALQETGITREEWDNAARPNAIKSFFKAIQPYPSTNQYKMLVTLYENANGLTESELKEKLSIDSGQAFGGIMGGITKSADKLGLVSSNIYTYGRTDDGRFVYKLTDEMLEVIKGEIW